jgi:hypothetical protein
MGASYVVCMSGNITAKPYPTDTQLNLVKTLRPLMAKTGAKTFIYQGGALIPLPGETLPCMARFVACLTSCIGREVFKDHENVYAYMQDSGMLKNEPYGTISVRPFMFSDVESIGKLEVASVPSIRTATIDVAQFYLDHLTDKSLFGTFPFIAY